MKVWCASSSVCEREKKNNSKATRPVFQATKPKKKNKQTQFFSTVAIPSINTTPIIRERERKATAHNLRVCRSFLALFLSLRSQSFCTLYNRLLLPLLPVSLPSPSPAWWMNGILGCPNPKKAQQNVERVIVSCACDLSVTIILTVTFKVIYFLIRKQKQANRKDWMVTKSTKRKEKTNKQQLQHWFIISCKQNNKQTKHGKASRLQLCKID